jgi:hypothetical protein
VTTSNRRLLAALAAFAAFGSGCHGSDSVVPQAGPPSKVTITTSPDSSAVVGQSAGTMRVVVVDAAGAAVSNATVNFTVSGAATVLPTSAITDASGAASTAVTAGRVAGPISVTASVSGSTATATAVVNVVASLAPCTGVATATPMNVGDVATFSGKAYACLSGTVAGAEFALVTFNSSTDATTALTATVTGTGLGTSPSMSIAATGSPLAARVPAVRGAQATLVPDNTFHVRLQARATQELQIRVPAARAWYRARTHATSPTILGTFTVAPSYSAVPSVVTVGQVLRVNVNSTDACSNPTYHGARVAAVGTKSIVLADTLNPAGGFTDADYARVAARFDTLVYPMDTGAFGLPTDIDNNGRIVILFTRAVNELTPANSGYYVGGFFYERDLYPASNTTGDPSFVCAASNEGEMFYMLAPDPNGVINGNVRRTGFVDTISTSTVAHEFQHLINASHRLYVNTAARNVSEAVWLNEGLSHVAEELLYYRESGKQPRTNLSGDSVYTNSRATYPSFKADASANFSRLISYLSSPGDNSPVTPNDSLATRGATWSFLRYAVDQLYPADGAVWSRFDNSTTSGLGTLAYALGPVDLTAMFRNWALANYLDDAGFSNIDPKYTHKSWNARSIYGTVFGSYISTVFTPLGYPLKVTPLSEGIGAPVSVRGTSASYYRLAVPAGREALLNFASGSAAPDPALQFLVVRTK